MFGREIILKKLVFFIGCLALALACEGANRKPEMAHAVGKIVMMVNR